MINSDSPDNIVQDGELANSLASPSCPETKQFMEEIEGLRYSNVDGTDGTVTEAGGNTKLQPRQNYAKKWCFTWNNYENENDWKNKLISRIGTVGTDFFIIGQEVGSRGTNHLQGYIEFKNRTRPIESIGIKAIHWEVAKGNREQNYIYCSKDNNILAEKGTEKIKADIRRRTIKIIETLKPWQKIIEDEFIKFMQEPEDRIIYWVYDKKGNKGKSALAKYLVVKHDFGFLSNAKTADIACYCANNKKDGYVLDFSRSFQDSINYGAIENLKNGLLFSSKYESGLVCINSPFIVCFSNDLPDIKKMSSDRWRIMNLDNEELKWEKEEEKKEKEYEVTWDDLFS